MIQAPFTPNIQNPDIRDLTSVVYDIDRLLTQSRAPVPELSDLPNYVSKALGKIGIELGCNPKHSIQHWQLYEHYPGISIMSYGGSLWHGHIGNDIFRVFDLKEFTLEKEVSLGVLAFKDSVTPTFTMYEPGATPGQTKLVTDNRSRSDLARIFACALDYPE